MSKPVILVGMHRSGTSMIGGMLDRLGVDMGDQPEHLKHHQTNILGHFEDKDFLKLNEALLSSIDASWDSPPNTLPPITAENLQRLKSLINEKQQSKLWGWKEPRTSVLLPYYLEVLEAPKIIHSHRSIDDIANSLVRRDHMERSRALQIAKHYEDALAKNLGSLSDTDKLRLNYDQVLKDPKSTVDSIVNFLKLKPSSEQRQAAIDIVMPKAERDKLIAKQINNDDPVSPLVSVVVLSWNTLDETKHCLKHIRKLNYPNFEIVVVDNGSTDGSKEYLADQIDVSCVDNSENHGFAGGQIDAWVETRGSYLALVNSDAAVSKNWLRTIVDVMQADKKIAAAGGRAYKWDADNPVFNSSNEFYSFQEVHKYSGHTKTNDYGDDMLEVDSISGAAVLIRRQAIEKTGYFDADFFAYYEETDLMARMLRAGQKIIYIPQAEVWHKIAGSSGGKPNAMYFYLMHRNRFQFALKNFDFSYMMRFIVRYKLEFLRALAKLLSRRGGLEEKAQIKAFGWNMVYVWRTLWKRRAVQKLGVSYSKKLQRQPRPTDVAVVISCYNYDKYVGEAIHSALDQSHKASQIIVVNDGSTDNSLEEIRKFSSKITLIDQKNKGNIGAKNAGLAKVNSYWTVFLDADDRLAPTYIEEMLTVAREQSATVAYSGMRLFGSTEGLFNSQPFNLTDFTIRNYINNSALIQTSLLNLVGGYKQEMSGGLEDWELFVSLFEHGASFGHIPRHLLEYRQHPDAISRNTEAAKNEAVLIAKIAGLHPHTFRRVRYRRRIPKKLRKYSAILLRMPLLPIYMIYKLPFTLNDFPTAWRAKVHAYIDDRSPRY